MWRIAVIVLVLLVADTAYSDNPTPSSGKESQPEQQQPKSRKKPPAKDDRGTERTPLFIKVVDAPKAQVDPEQNKNDANEKPSTYWGLTANGWTAVFTGLMVAIVLGQLFLFLRQLRYIRESLVDTKVAADAAQKSADAAERTVSTMKDTAERQLRAYLVVENAQIIPNPQRINIIIRNTGQTPAFDVQHWGSASMKAFPLSTTEDFPAPSGLLFMSKNTVGPGITVHKYIVIPLFSAIDTAELVSGQKAIYVWGDVTYRDAFNVIRHTRYRAMAGGNVGFQGNSLAYCDEGNEAT